MPAEAGDIPKTNKLKASAAGFMRADFRSPPKTIALRTALLKGNIEEWQ
jgi:hypothetical protein